MQGRAPIRVVIVDDHQMFLHALSSLLTVEDDIEVVATMSDPRVVGDIASDADVVLMDLLLPAADGLELTRQVRATRPAQQVIVISGRSDDGAERDAFDAGAAAFLLKGGLGPEVAQTIRSVAAGAVAAA
ncbi:MAG: response regulator transcription factor [Gaiellaceae bacterium]